jgi:hypothetical protein
MVRVPVSTREPEMAPNRASAISMSPHCRATVVVAGGAGREDGRSQGGSHAPG